MNRGVPIIEFIEDVGKIKIYCDGEVVGIVFPSMANNAGERFMRRMRNLRLLINDEVVDVYKFIQEVVEKNR